MFKRMIWITLLLISFASSAQAQRLNATLLPSFPTTISNNAVTSIDNGDGTYSIFSFMGTQVPRRINSVTTEAYRLDWPGGSWTRIHDAPHLNDRGKLGASAISVNGEVYLIGGYTLTAPEVTEKRLFRYNPGSDDYTELAPMPVEVDDTMVGVFDDRYIFTVSGWHGPINDNVLNTQYYDTVTDTWHQSTPLPGPATGTFGHSGTIIGNQIVTTDGVTSNNGFRITDATYAGTITDPMDGSPLQIEWDSIDSHPGLPTYRAAASQGGLNDKVLLLGGTDNPYNFNGIAYTGGWSVPLDQAVSFDMNSGEWQTWSITGDHVPTMDHRGLVPVGDGWVLVGGMEVARFASDRVVMYTVPEPSPTVSILIAMCVMTVVRRFRRTITITSE